MTKRYYTVDKTGEEVEVDSALASQLVKSGKRKPEDFTIEEEPDAMMQAEGIAATSQPQGYPQNPSMMDMLLPRTKEAWSQPRASEIYDESGKPLILTKPITVKDMRGIDPADIMDIFARGLAALRGEEGKTRAQTMATPGANILNPEIEESVDYYGAKAAEAEESGSPAMSKFYKGLGGVAEYAGPSLGDPTVYSGIGLSKIPGTTAKVVEKMRTPRNVASNIAEAGAKKTQNIILAPKAHHLKGGYDTENVFKHGVQGSVDEVLEKTQTKIDDAARRLNETIKKGNTPDVQIDPRQAINELHREILKDRVKNSGISQEMTPAFRKMRNIIDFALGGKKTFGLKDAHEFKQQLGAMGDWQYVASQRGFQLDPEATALSKIASELYGKMKERIIKDAPEGLQEINKELTELIPIKNVALSRKAVTDRANVVSLGDMMGTLAAIGGGPKGLLLWAAVRGQKAGTTAKGLHSLAQKLQKATDPKDVKRFTDALGKVGVTKAEIDFIRNIKDDEESNQADPTENE